MRLPVLLGVLLATSSCLGPTEDAGDESCLGGKCDELTDRAPARLFEGDDPLAFELAAPFAALNQLGGGPDAAGALSVAGVTIPVTLATRGASSRFECSFLKLEVSFGEEPIEPGGPTPRELTIGTPFEGVPSFKLDTHCAVESPVVGEELPEGSLSGRGRLVADVAPLREGVLYRIYQTLTPFGHAVRPAMIRYVETGGAAPTPLFDRPALLVERFKHLRKRHDGVELGPEMIDSRDDVDRATLAVEVLFQAMIGNADWQVGDLGQNGTLEIEGGIHGLPTLWNHHAMALPDGRVVAVPGDFDIAGLATLWPGRAPREGELHPDQAAAFYAGHLAAFAAAFTPAEQAAAVDRLRAARPGIEAAVASAPIDAGGRAMMEASIAAFFEGL